jgi:hypothetical protein
LLKYFNGDARILTYVGEKLVLHYYGIKLIRRGGQDLNGVNRLGVMFLSTGEPRKRSVFGKNSKSAKNFTNVNGRNVRSILSRFESLNCP